MLGVQEGALDGFHFPQGRCPLQVESVTGSSGPFPHLSSPFSTCMQLPGGEHPPQRPENPDRGDLATELCSEPPGLLKLRFASSGLSLIQDHRMFLGGLSFSKALIPDHEQTAPRVSRRAGIPREWWPRVLGDGNVVAPGPEVPAQKETTEGSGCPS